MKKLNFFILFLITFISFGCSKGNISKTEHKKQINIDGASIGNFAVAPQEKEWIINIARREAKKAMIIPKDSPVRVEKAANRYIVTFENPSKEPIRASYIAEVILDGEGEVIKILVGS